MFNFQIEEEWFGRSVIRSCTKLSYDHAQGFIEQPEREWTQEELPPISEKYSVSDIKTRVINLHKVSYSLVFWGMAIYVKYDDLQFKEMGAK